MQGLCTLVPLYRLFYYALSDFFFFFFFLYVIALSDFLPG